jgi:ketosteroid isomerase-like protein
VLSLYSQDAVFTYDGDVTAIGRQQIESALSGFLLSGLKFRGSYVSLHVNGDTALTRMKWELVDANGAVTSTGVSAEVQRQGPDGLWRFVLDDVTGGYRP